MKKSVLFVLLLAFTMGVIYESNAQEISGVIHYDDGSTQEFIDISNLSVTHEDGGYYGDGLVVKYRNSYRDVPFENLKRLTVERFSTDDSDGSSPNNLFNVYATIETTTGVETDSYYSVFNYVHVQILDELTGQKKEQIMEFAIDREINIRAVEFDN